MSVSGWATRGAIALRTAGWSESGPEVNTVDYYEDLPHEMSRYVGGPLRVGGRCVDRSLVEAFLI